MTEALIQKINDVSEEYYAMCQELAHIAEGKGTAWLELRRHSETNAEADQLWSASDDGSREAYLKIYLKGLEKRRGAYILEYKANAGNF